MSKDIEHLNSQVQSARDATDMELKKRLQLNKEAKEFESEAQKTVNELMRQLKESKTMKEKGEAQLQQQLDIQLEYGASLWSVLEVEALCDRLTLCILFLFCVVFLFVFLFVFPLVFLYVLFVLSLLSPTLRSPVFTASTMKRERDRQIENSKSATAALREDAETQRRLAGLLEKEKTELKNMLQEKWKEARHLKDRLEESDAKLYEASNTVDNWQETKRDLENTVDKQKRRMHEIKTKASATEDRISAELKDATGYGIVCGGG